MKNLVFVIVVLASVLISCEKEFIIKIEDADKKIVVNAVFNNQEAFEVEVTKSFSPYGNLEVIELNNATVSLYEDGTFIENLVYSKLPNDSIGKFRSAVTSGIGKEYSIEVSEPDLGKASSTSSVPDGVNISSATVSNVFWYEDNLDSYRYSFSFTIDDPDTKDYYFLTMRLPIQKLNNETAQYEYCDYEYAEILSGGLPQAQLYLKNGLIFNDDVFNNSNYVVSGTATLHQYPSGQYWGSGDDYILDSTKLHISIHHLSKELYTFYSSYAAKLINDNDIYIEPIPIYSNIENGLGIFGGENITLKKVDIAY